MKYLQYAGILLGALYGVGYRLICGAESVNGIFEHYSLFSVSFIFVLPLVIAILPVLIAREAILESRWKQVLFPVLSVLLFFVFTLTSKLEDLLCILIIAAPFLIGAAAVGLLVAFFMKKKKNSKKLYSIVLLPIILNPLEPLLPDKLESFEAKSKIVINADSQSVWDNIIEVPEIEAGEYDAGFFNYIGVPRPIKSKLKMVDGTEYRIGTFSENLKLYETVSKLEPMKYVAFKIHINKSELRDLPTDKHLLKGDYFKFNRISYRLRHVSPNKTELTLSCEYTLNSKMNAYANFWAETIIKDFEGRLLKVLKLKIEAQER